MSLVNEVRERLMVLCENPPPGLHVADQVTIAAAAGLLREVRDAPADDPRFGVPAGAPPPVAKDPKPKAKRADAVPACVGGGRHKWGPDGKCAREGCTAVNPRQATIPGAA